MLQKHENTECKIEPQIFSNSEEDMVVIEVSPNESNTKDDENVTDNKWTVELNSTSEAMETDDLTEVVKTEQIEIDEILSVEKPEIYSGIIFNLKTSPLGIF